MNDDVIAWGDGGHGGGPGAVLEGSLRKRHVKLELTDSERDRESISSRGTSRWEAPRQEGFFIPGLAMWPARPFR